MKKGSNWKFLGLLAAVAMSALAASCATARAAPTVGGAPDTAGVWKSVSSEDAGNGAWATREFTMMGKDWQVVYSCYLDKDMNMPVFAFRAVAG